MPIVRLFPRAAFVLAFASIALADVRLPHALTSHMVMQRDRPIVVWGWAEPDEAVQVALGEQSANTKAGPDGRWRIELPALAAGGPHTLVVHGRNELKLDDILIGDVWFCSGQSNMGWGINQVADGEAEVAKADYPQIRLFKVPWKTAPAATDDVDATWQVCTPQTLGSGGLFNAGFSAVAYFYGRALQRELNVPIGLIDCAWGGTRIEPWTTRAGFAADPQFADIVKRIDDATPRHTAALEKALGEYDSWLPQAKATLAAGRPVADPPAWPRHDLDNNTAPTGIYNGMVHALTPLPIRGWIWYQGESNLGDGMRYRDKMQALIAGWRGVWGRDDLPFYFVQLAPYRYPKTAPDALPRIWEAQTAALAIPHTGMAVTVDIGDVNDIHPKNKRDVGERLALCALAGTFGRDDLVYSGPLFQAMVIEEPRARIRFAHADGGLAVRGGGPAGGSGSSASNGGSPAAGGGELTEFEIAGEDRKFFPAHAVIDGSEYVAVWSERVPHPVAVRFAWRHDAQPNLMNKAGLPASPFRTDDW